MGVGVGSGVDVGSGVGKGASVGSGVASGVSAGVVTLAGALGGEGRKVSIPIFRATTSYSVSGARFSNRTSPLLSIATHVRPLLMLYSSPA